MTSSTESSIILASATAPRWWGESHRTTFRPPWQGEDKVLAISLARGASHAADLSLNQSLSPCASESRFLQHLFLAARQGSGPARHPRGHQLKPGFVPVPRNALCAERSDCHGEQHPSYQHSGGVGGLRPTLITYLAAITRTSAMEGGPWEVSPPLANGNWVNGLPRTSPHSCQHEA